MTEDCLTIMAAMGTEYTCPPSWGVPAHSDDACHQVFPGSVTRLLKEAGCCVYQWRLIQFNSVETKLIGNSISYCLGISCGA